MTTIDEIMVEVIESQDAALSWYLHTIPESELDAQVAKVRVLITQAIAEARAEGAMEEAQRIFPCCGGNDESPAEHTMDCPDKREPVRLTDEAVADACRDIAIAVAQNCGSVPQLTHPHIYLGVRKLLAANGLTK